MLTSITPLGQRGRGRSAPVTAAAYAVGSLLSATALGALLGLGGSLLPLRHPGLLLAVGCAAAAVLEAAGRRPPSWRRQVDERWLSTYRSWVTGLGYGGQLGLGVVTIVSSAATYAALLAELLLAAPGPSALVGAVFGLSRAAPVLLAAPGPSALVGAVFGLSRAGPVLLALRVHDPAALARLGRGLARGARPARAATAVLLIVAALGAGA